MGLCAQTPGHIVVQEKGFSCTRIVYHNGRYFAHRKKYNFFGTHLLTVLTISVILQLEQRKGVLRKEKIKW